MTNTIYTIYKITNKTNNKSYIGQTFRSIQERFAEHIRSSNNDSNFQIHQAIRKYGKSNFLFETIFNSIDYHTMNDIEEYFISYYDTYNNGYNMTRGGSKISPNCVSTYWKGKSIPEDIKEKIRLTQSGGYYFCFNKRYSSLREASKATGLGRCTIKKYCKENNHIITYYGYSNSKSLQEYYTKEGINPVGLTTKQLGFSFRSN